MSRYIDADEAIKVMACEMYAEAQSQGYDVDGVEDFIPEATAWMNDAPSIDIVQCKECKHFEKNDSILRGEWWCDLWADTIEDDGYCSYGERSKQ